MNQEVVLNWRDQHTIIEFCSASNTHLSLHGDLSVTNDFFLFHPQLLNHRLISANGKDNSLLSILEIAQKLSLMNLSHLLDVSNVIIMAEEDIIIGADHSDHSMLA